MPTQKIFLSVSISHVLMNSLGFDGVPNMMGKKRVMAIRIKNNNDWVLDFHCL